MFIKLLIWVLKKVFESQKRKSIEPCIKELYRRMADDDLKIRAEIVKVKKGKRRYDLLFLETKTGLLKFNLGRHWEDRKEIEKIVQ